MMTQKNTKKEAKQIKEELEECDYMNYYNFKIDSDNDILITANNDLGIIAGCDMDSFISIAKKYENDYYMSMNNNKMTFIIHK